MLADLRAGEAEEKSREGKPEEDAEAEVAAPGHAKPPGVLLRDPPEELPENTQLASAKTTPPPGFRTCPRASPKGSHTQPSCLPRPFSHPNKVK